MTPLARAFALASRLDAVGLPVAARLVERVDPTPETLAAVEALVDELTLARPAMALALELLEHATADPSYPAGAERIADALATLRQAMGAP